MLHSHLIQACLGPPRVQISNSISICSAIFAGLTTGQTDWLMDRPTDRACLSLWSESRFMHAVHLSLISWNNPKWDYVTLLQKTKCTRVHDLVIVTTLYNMTFNPRMTAEQKLETGLNWLMIAAVVQWLADTPWQQTLCPSLSEPQIINAFKSDYIATATAAEARILFALRPTISWLSSSLCSIRGPCVCSLTFQRQFMAEI